MKIDTHQDLKIFFDSNYRNAVIRANRIVQNQATAEDLVQDCLIKLWEQKDRLQAGSIEGYFATMVRNKSIDFLRKKKPKLIGTDAIQIAAEDNSSLELAELQAKIDRAIDSLPERCREVFVLSRFENMSYREIAESLVISPKTVENHISKALKVLTTALNFILFLFFFK